MHLFCNVLVSVVFIVENNKVDDNTYNNQQNYDTADQGNEEVPRTRKATENRKIETLVSSEYIFQANI